jgi:hypothetical protein
MFYYRRDAGFVNYFYWTSDATGSYQFTVNLVNGYVSSISASHIRLGLCTAP